MTPRELVKAALDFKEYDVVPIEARDVTEAPYGYPPWFVGVPQGHKGRRVDPWGCTWESLEDGVCGEVKGHPLADWSQLAGFSAPWHILKQADLSGVNRFCAETDMFVINQWEPPMPNLFERMQHLRGTENLFMDLAYGDKRVITLRDMLQEYFLEQMEMWCRTGVDAVQFADDWGSQKSLLISPVTWREYFKPLYRQYCDLAHSNGKYILMHSDGYVADIIPDLIEIGVDALNLQLFCMDIEQLADRYHHQVAFWGEIDRQYIQVFGTEDDMHKAVRRLANAFFRYGRTGFIAQCTYTMNVPEANKRAEWDEWRQVMEDFNRKASP